MNDSVITIANPALKTENNDSLPSQAEMITFNSIVATEIARYHTSNNPDEKSMIEKNLRQEGINEGWISPKPSERRDERESSAQYNVKRLVQFVETDKLLVKTRNELKQQAQAHGVNLEDSNQLHQLSTSRQNFNGRHLATMWKSLESQGNNKELYLGVMMDFRHPPDISSINLERKTKHKNGATSVVFNPDSVSELSKKADKTKREIEVAAEAMQMQAMWDHMAEGVMKAVWPK